MSTNLTNPKDQADHKKGTLGNQPRLMHITPTVLLGRWGQQLLRVMTFLGTDFEMHANWQEYAEGPTAKDFVARKACNHIRPTARNPLEQDQVQRALE